MVDESPFRHILEQAEQQLWVAFESTKAIQHSGLKGSGREDAVGEFLSSQLPSRFAIAKGEAFDAKRRRSAQLDLVVYDKTHVQPLKIGAEDCLIPAEALLAVVEVKSKLSREEIRRALQGAKKLAELRPYGKEFIFSRPGGADASDRQPRCLITIFGFESDLSANDWTSREWARLREVATAEQLPVERIDRVVVLDRGLIVPPTCSGHAIDADAPKGLLREWFLHLSNFLVREAPRRQPFEWQPYVGRDATVRWIKLEGYASPQKKLKAPPPRWRRGRRGGRRQKKSRE